MITVLESHLVALDKIEKLEEKIKDLNISSEKEQHHLERKCEIGVDGF